MIDRSFLSNLEMSWLRKPNFFPNREEALASKTRICIGTKSRNVGDSLILTPLAASLKQRYPEIQIYAFPRAFNPVVFFGNPYIEGISHFPTKVFGDDCSWGEGHLIRQKQRFFDLPIVSEEECRPQIFLQDSEKIWANNFLKPTRSGKPLCVLHPSGVTWKNLLPTEFWSSIVQRWSHSYDFLQIGMKGDALLGGCPALHFQKGSFWEARKLFAILSQAQLLIGIDSGPMHAARAFQIPSLIFMSGKDPEVIFKNRSGFPYFLAGNRRYSNLYKSNTHFRVDDRNRSDLDKAVDSYLDTAPVRT